jgi:hypothetical protein
MDLMAMDTEGLPRLRDELLVRISGDDRLARHVDAAFDATDPTQAHIAVLQQPYLRYVLTGRKTIESRFGRIPTAPYRVVAPGDVLLFKQVAGPLLGVGIVAAADFYVLDPAVWATLRNHFAAALCATDSQFWVDRRDARFATLMRLAAVRRISPLTVDKRDRRGWVVLDVRGQAVHRDQLRLTATETPRRRVPLAVSDRPAHIPQSHEPVRGQLSLLDDGDASCSSSA